MRNRIPVLIVVLFVEIILITYMLVFGHASGAGILLLGFLTPFTIMFLVYDMVVWVNQIAKENKD